MIVDSFNMPPDAHILIQPFLFGGSKNQPTELSVVFEINKKIYTYYFLVNKEKILKEELKLTSFAKKKQTTKKLFSRSWNDKNNLYSLHKNNFKLPKGFEKFLRINSSIIASASRFNHIESQEIIKY